MDRAQASRLVSKLQALAADPAATEAEKALAGAKAQALSARFGLAEEGRPPRQARRRYHNGRVWVVSPDSSWGFVASTGEGSAIAKGKHRWGDWRITVDIGWRTSETSWSSSALGDRSRHRRR
jgi:hypothetical protein